MCVSVLSFSLVGCMQQQLKDVRAIEQFLLETWLIS